LKGKMKSGVFIAAAIARCISIKSRRSSTRYDETDINGF
jgi:hypothetical protein